MSYINRVYKCALILLVLSGTTLCADERWYFEDTVIVGTNTGDATVTGYVTVNAGNWLGPTEIVLTGPFGILNDNGSQLQLDEGDQGWTDSTVLFSVALPSDNLALTVDPLVSFTFTSAFPGSAVIDTYSLVSGELSRVDPTPEPGTAGMLIAGMALAALGMKRRAYLAARSLR